MQKKLTLIDFHGLGMNNCIGKWWTTCQSIGRPVSYHLLDTFLVHKILLCQIFDKLILFSKYAETASWTKLRLALVFFLRRLHVPMDVSDRVFSFDKRMRGGWMGQSGLHAAQLVYWVHCGSLHQTLLNRKYLQLLWCCPCWLLIYGHGKWSHDDFRCQTYIYVEFCDFHFFLIPPSSVPLLLLQPLLLHCVGMHFPAGQDMIYLHVPFT